MHPTPGGDSPTPTTDKIFAFIRRCIRTGFCSPDLADFHDISSGEKLFNKILTCPNHILRTLLPPPTAQNYSLRNRPHDRQLPHVSNYCNFTVRMLYRNMCWLLYISDLRFVLFLCTTAVWQFAINEYVMVCYVTNLPENMTVKNYENRLRFGEATAMSLVSPVYGTRCTTVYTNAFGNYVYPS